MTGDITITWDEKNKEKIVAMIKKKMDEGYTFFTTVKIPLVEIYRKKKISAKHLDSVNVVVIPDEQFEKMVKDMNDRDVASLVQDGDVGLAKRKDRGSIGVGAAAKVERDAEKVAASQSVGVRPLAGG